MCTIIMNLILILARLFWCFRLHIILTRFRAGSSIRGSGGTLHQAIEKVLHPDYDNKTADYDIAVLKVRMQLQCDVYLKLGNAFLCLL